MLIFKSIASAAASDLTLIKPMAILAAQVTLSEVGLPDSNVKPLHRNLQGRFGRACRHPVWLLTLAFFLVPALGTLEPSSVRLNAEATDIAAAAQTHVAPAENHDPEAGHACPAPLCHSMVGILAPGLQLTARSAAPVPGQGPFSTPEGALRRSVLRPPIA